jgi:hypothetical protein
MEMNDYLSMKALEKDGLSPYEQYKVGFLQTKGHTGGVAIAGLVLGTVGAAAAVGAWIFGPTYANAKAGQAKEAAQSAKELAAVQIAASQRQIDQLTALFAAERNERINGDFTLNQTITDTVSGQQASTLTAQQAAELSAVNSVMQQTYSDFVTGRASLNPTPVSIYQAPIACPCPGSCGCNG